MITKQDIYSGLINGIKLLIKGTLSNIPLVGWGATIESKVAKYMTYEKMIDDCIANTEEAIAFLEEKLKEME